MTARPAPRAPATATARRKPAAVGSTSVTKRAPAARPPAAPEPAAPAPAETGTWVLQADAATATGFSVSAIRKWRRSGLVADRKRTTAGGLERVEVRLEDVEARLSEQPTERPRPAPAPPEAGPPAGSAIIAIADMEALFARVREAEARADQAEARLQAAEVEARFMSGQMAELRRQVQTAGAEAVAARAAVDDRRSVGPTIAPANATGNAPANTPTNAATKARATARPEPDAGDQGSAGARRAFDRLTLDRGTIDLLGLDLARERIPAAPSAAPGGNTPPPTPPTPIRSAGSRTGPGPSPRAASAAPRPPLRTPSVRPGPAPPGSTPSPQPVAPTRRTEIESLATELRRLYSRLDGYRREPTISRARERQRERDLGDYDASLLHACAALDIPTGLRGGEAMTIERRAALTQTLARLGLDVRADPTATSHRA
ncbi:MAG: hypothetical protein QOG43_1500 [Actinomycetota bacterium]|nr:hypothetical protein [Actinomycetota bacterium]